MLILAIVLTYLALMFLGLGALQIIRLNNDLYKGKDTTDQRTIIGISFMLFAMLTVLAIIAWTKL